VPFGTIGYRGAESRELAWATDSRLVSKMMLRHKLGSAKLERSTVLYPRHPQAMHTSIVVWSAIEICIASRSCVIASYSNGVLAPAKSGETEPFYLLRAFRY
jgi:hypothetical protein